nr:MAG TPA: hypothetical protein [Caudoviricetes sp.]
MKNASNRPRCCPCCGQTYTGYPSISRIDNRQICPDCGTREALGTLGISDTEKEQIIQAIHSSFPQTGELQL